MPFSHPVLTKNSFFNKPKLTFDKKNCVLKIMVDQKDELENTITVSLSKFEVVTSWDRYDTSKPPTADTKSLRCNNFIHLSLPVVGCRRETSTIIFEFYRFRESRSEKLKVHLAHAKIDEKARKKDPKG